MSCDHQWTPNNQRNDLGYHCRTCGFDPGNPIKVPRCTSRLGIRLVAGGKKWVTVCIMPTIFGYLMAGEQGAIYGGIVSTVATAMMLVGGYSFGSIFYFFEN